MFITRLIAVILCRKPTGDSGYAILMSVACLPGKIPSLDVKQRFAVPHGNALGRHVRID